MRQAPPFQSNKLVKADLKPEEREMLEKIAAWIVKRGMAVPSIMFLESVKPLSYVSAQVVVFFAPALEILFDPVRISTFVNLMEDKKNIDIFLQEIETQDNEHRKQIKELKKKKKEEKRQRKEQRRCLKCKDSSTDGADTE